MGWGGAKNKLRVNMESEMSVGGYVGHQLRSPGLLVGLPINGILVYFGGSTNWTFPASGLQLTADLRFNSATKQLQY